MEYRILSVAFCKCIREKKEHLAMGARWITVLCLAVPVLASGCMSTIVYLRNEEDSAEIKEFREICFKGPTSNVITGAFVGLTQRDGASYLCYEFSGVLAGPDGRILKLLVPSVTNVTHPAVATETSTPNEQVSEAQLHFMKWSHPYSPGSYFKEPGAVSRSSVVEEHTLLLRFPAPGAIHHHDLYRNAVPVSSGTDEWTHYDVKYELEWYARKRSFFSSPLWYVVAVPFDLATAPIQFFWIWYSEARS